MARVEVGVLGTSRLAAHRGTGLALLRLVDEHHRDPIPNRVAAAASIAYDALALEPNGSLTCGTSEDLQKLLIDHPHLQACEAHSSLRPVRARIIGRSAIERQPDLPNRFPDLLSHRSVLGV
jgi:hypothetical protein